MIRFPLLSSPRIHCIQTNNDREAATVFASSDVYILPSLFEGTPLTLVEAMMSGATGGDYRDLRDEGFDSRWDNGVLVATRSPQEHGRN